MTIVLVNTLQIVICVEGKVFNFQNFTKKSPYTINSSPIRKLYVAFTENTTDSTSFQIHLWVVPSPSTNNLLLSNNYNNCSVWLDSHTKRAILHPSFHNHLLLLQSRTCDRVRPISKELKNNLGIFCIKGTLSTHLFS